MLQRNVFPHPPHVCPAQPTQHKKILLKILSQTATYSSTTYRSPKLCCTTHTTQKKFPSNSPLKLLLRCIVRPNSRGTTRNSPQNFSTQNCRYVSFARVRPAQPTQQQKIPLKISSSPKNSPQKFSTQTVSFKFARHNHTTQKNSPQKFWFQLELDGRETGVEPGGETNWKKLTVGRPGGEANWKKLTESGIETNSCFGDNLGNFGPQQLL